MRRGALAALLLAGGASLAAVPAGMARRDAAAEAGSAPVAADPALRPRPSADPDGPRVETLPAQVAATVGHPIVLPPRRIEGGTPPFARRLDGPPGIGLGALGTLTIAPSVPGTTGPYRLTVTDADGRSASTETYVVAAPPLRLVEPVPAPATLGQRFRARFAAEGGRPPYAWSFSGRSPEGLTFSNGILGGVPASVGTVSDMVVTVTDADGRQSFSGLFSIAVAAPLTLQSLPDTVDAVSGQAVVLPPPAVAGGTPPYRREVSGEGATIAPDGSIRVRPGRPGESATVEYVVRDAVDRTASARTRMASSEPLRVGTYAGATLARGVEARVDGPAVTGGRGSGRRALVDDATGAEARPPRGLAFAAGDGAIGGIPGEAGTFGPYRIRAFDEAGRHADSLPFVVTVAESPPASTASRREVSYDGRRPCLSSGSADCAHDGNVDVVEIRFPALRRVNEVGFGCDFSDPPAGVWELFDGRRWATAEATALGPCSAIVPETAILAARFTRVEGAFARIWAPRATYAP